MGRGFILIGILFILIGAIMLYAPQLLNWFGKLPGDLRFGSGRSKVFIPISSMIVISIVLTILINLFRR